METSDSKFLAYVSLWGRSNHSAFPSQLTVPNKCSSKFMDSWPSASVQVRYTKVDSWARFARELYAEDLRPLFLPPSFSSSGFHFLLWVFPTARRRFQPLATSSRWGTASTARTSAGSWTSARVHASASAFFLILPSSRQQLTDRSFPTPFPPLPPRVRKKQV